MGDRAVRTISWLVGICCASLAAAVCGGGASTSAARPQPVDGRVKALADSYLEGFFDRNPDQVTLYGVPGRRHDKLPDNSLDALQAWQSKEDAWLKDTVAIDIAAIQEVRENFAHLEDVVRHIGAPYTMLFSDAAGNDERMAFVYDSQKLRLLEEIGIPLTDCDSIGQNIDFDWQVVSKDGETVRKRAIQSCQL